MTHVWPASDTFTAGAVTAFGDHLGAYIRCALALTVSVNHPTAGTYSLPVAAADFNDLYSQTGNVPKYPTPYNVTRSTALWRALESNADQTVTLGFHSKALSGSGHDWADAQTMILVAARVQGGTYTAATNQITDVTGGYVFGFLRTLVLGGTWYLLRIDGASTFTVLEEVTFDDATIALPEMNAFESNEIALTLEDNAGDVDLTATLRTPAGTVTIFTHTDSSGSKITTAGRCGFTIDGKRSVTGGIVATQATFFQITDAGTLHLRDEWIRAYRRGGTAASDVIGAVTWQGFSVMQAFVGDWHGITAYQRLIYRSKVAGQTDRLNFDPVAAPVGTGTGAGGFLASHRRSTDRRSQNRSLLVRFSTLQQDGTAGTTDPSPFRQAGVFVRMGSTLAPSDTFEPTSAYLFFLRRDDAGGTGGAFLLRWFHGTLTTLASNAGFTVNTNTDYTVRLDAYNLLDAGGNNTGAVQIRCFVNGSQVVLTAISSAVTADSLGTVHDGSSQRITEGGLEGMYVFLPDGDRTIFVDSWSEGALTNASTGNPQDMASIAVPGELDDESGQTLEIPVDWPIEELRYQPVHEKRMESGHVRVHPRFTDERRVWEVAASALTDDERDDLRDFWAAHQGVQLPFSWVPPGQTTAAKVAIVEPEASLEDVLRDVGVSAFRFQLEERFA